MGQQLAIMVMVDVEAAIKEDNIGEHIYLMDNMKQFGSQNEGTKDLSSAVNGTYWPITGTQASEQVLNWLITGIASLPMTLPKEYLQFRQSLSEKESLEGVQRIKDVLTNNAKSKDDPADSDKHLSELNSVISNLGMEAGVNITDEHHVPQKFNVLDLAGQAIKSTRGMKSKVSYLPPVIIDVTGEAVDEKVIFPAQYGSPSSNTYGWYWSASVDTSRPGRYSYDLHIRLFELKNVKDKLTWEPKDFIHRAYIDVSSDPMENGFTGGADSYLPIPAN
ncbi:hypothetical protein [Aureibacter tunicatorum]|uniref:Uncharacterized protein n=1 Tax=Aureibacter tunicatorum TaxID=866807 RepID=A0AAE3XLX6_9BACT|nr:hypothetical protein [Aureibacter tunicatorum]MDR6238201.1 hypothetical protein [Aureibacter tunicatorum]BDD03234.1 hypothetical protein AUTU_07170 [Aureibacter tunicatorum]